MIASLQFLIFEDSTATAERSFSNLELIKNSLRISIGQEQPTVLLKKTEKLEKLVLALDIITNEFA